ncbi:MAG: hypothetical protein ACRCZM_06120 [Bacteroidales bacterium]
MVSVYSDRSGIRWWTKAWFNNQEEGESSIEITRQLAILFIHNQVAKDVWLEEYFPKQMEIYHHAIKQTKEQLLNQLNV